MKLLTVLIPVYNTEKYIKRCLDSVLLRNVLDDIEVLVVIDGSEDRAGEIAKRYESKYPNTIKVIEKENGGHGSTINKGLEIATGKYFRVLDSDDWFHSINFIEFVKRLRDEKADLVVCNYRREEVYDSRSRSSKYEQLKDHCCYHFETFDLALLKGKYFVMATSAYRTEILRKSGVQLLEKTFYVDMMLNVVPMTIVETFSFYDLDLYRYFVGRQDQSTNRKNFARNQEDHKRMIQWLVEYYSEIKERLYENQRKYIEMILLYTLYTHYIINCEYEEDYHKSYKEIVNFDQYLLSVNPDLYEKLNTMIYVRCIRKTRFQVIEKYRGIWKIVIALGRLIKRCGV